MEILIFIIMFAVFGYLAKIIGDDKNRDSTESFMYGFFLGVIGIIIVACLPSKPKDQN